MPEFETDRGKVVFDEVERIISPDGDVSVMKFQSQTLEALEELVTFLRDSGLFTPIEDYQEQNGSEGSIPNREIQPRTIYLACPAPQAEITVFLN